MLDSVVRERFGASWGDARAWITSGKIAVGGEVVTDPTVRVEGDAAIERTMNAPRPRRDEELSRDAIVFIDAHVVVVAKPAGISTIPFEGAGDPGDEDATLDVRVRVAIAKMDRARGRASHGPATLGVVHRIDKETSGLVVFTRTWLAKKSLASQFREHSVHRRYLAIAHGNVRAQTIRSHLVDDRGDGRRGSIERSERRARQSAGEGQLAITHVEPVEELDGATLVACTLETGRTHQIRIHMSEAGHPLVGERVYMYASARDARDARANDATRAMIHAPRLMLHAAELGFVHPATERDVRWEEPLPADFKAVLARLRRA
jgi:23S rRNA pseudouridine1911/1915/1917 synthase